jgi:hypothetical protein
MKTSAYDWYPKPESCIDLGNGICRMIDDLLAEVYGVKIGEKQVKIKVEEAQHENRC